MKKTVKSVIFTKEELKAIKDHLKKFKVKKFSPWVRDVVMYVVRNQPEGKKSR